MTVSNTELSLAHKQLAAYYAKCAATYESVYAKPERQADLAILRSRVADVLQGQRVLELACGSGYWTEQLAQGAASVLATDINPAMIELARSKTFPPGRVEIALADAFNLQADRSFSACFAGFWWSHVGRAEQAAFLTALGAKMGKDALLVLIDNSYVEGSNTPIARTDADGNTYQIRTLADGERCEVIKNFPTDSALRKKFAAALKDIRIVRLEYYWMLTARFK
jgi:SAM-dependent methyltransferase